MPERDRADADRHPSSFKDGRVTGTPGFKEAFPCEALNGAPNQRIRRFVEGGGVYLGICAGVYYACREVAFHAGIEGAILQRT